MKPQAIYLDCQASTPTDPRVLKAMQAWQELCFANPHSVSHTAGLEAQEATRKARRQIASAVHADTASIIFTSGATEANNLAIQGVAKASTQRRKIITVASEHKSVLSPAHALAPEGFEICVLPVTQEGTLGIEDLKNALDENTLLVSVMSVNNETGVIQPVREIAAYCHEAGALFHSDCAQALAKIDLDFKALDADLITLSSHKAYGPKGIGALVVRQHPKIPIHPILYGGDQERGLRPGTLPVPLCVGFGEAARIASKEIEQDTKRIVGLTNTLIENIQAALPAAQVVGGSAPRAPGSFNITFPGATSDELLNAFEGIHVSTGSACTSTALTPSHVLTAYGFTQNLADASIRFGIGRFTTEEEIQRASDIIQNGIQKLHLENKN